MYTRILTPLDGSEVSEHVLPYARALASGLSLLMTVLMAVEPEHPTISRALNPLMHWHETEDHRTSHAESYLSSVTARMGGAGLAVEGSLIHSDPATGIVEEAAKDPGVLIAMASHGRSGLARWWMGSVADKVLHTADNPLLIVRSQSELSTAQEQALERLVVPVDGSELAEEVFPHVAYLSQALGLPVDLLQVTLSEAEYYQAMSMGLRVLPPTLPSFQSFSETVDGEAMEYLANAKTRLTQMGAEPVQERVLQGAAADTIVDLATSRPNNLVAMTTHGRSGVGRMILGSVAERVVRQSGGPVLLIRAHHREEMPLTGAPAEA